MRRAGIFVPRVLQADVGSDSPQDPLEELPQESGNSWNLGIPEWPGLPGQESQEKERKSQIPVRGVPGGKPQPFPEASRPPSQDKAVAKPSGPSLHPSRRAEKRQERGDKAGVGEGDPCQAVQVVTLAQPLSLCLGTAVCPEHP